MSTENENESIDNAANNHDGIFREIKLSQNILTALQNNVQFKILGFLYNYNEMSLTELSTKLKVSKGTILNHVKKMTELNLIQMREERVKGPKKSNIYSVKDDFDYNTLTWLNHEDLDVFDNPDIDIFEWLNSLLEIDKKIFDVGKKFFIHLQKLVSNSQNELTNLSKKRAHDKEDAKEIFIEGRPLHYMFFLDEEEKDIYLELAEQFKNDLLTRIYEKRKKTPKNDEPKKGKNYIGWNLFMPYKKMLEADL